MPKRDLSPTRDTSLTRDLSPTRDTAPTLAAALRQQLADCSWRQAEALCRSGRVLVDGEPATDPARRLAPGEQLTVLPTAPRPKPLLAAEEAIVYLDRDLVVARKPPGLLTVPWEEDDGSPSLVVALRELLQKLDRPRGLRHLPPLGVVSRLDKASSGLVVFARNEAAREALEKQFAAHDLEREYLALTQGRPREGLYRSTLADDRGDGWRGSVGSEATSEGPAPRAPAGATGGRPAPHRSPATGGRPAPRASTATGVRPNDGQAHSYRGGPAGKLRRAVTWVRILETAPSASLVACRLETGRKHQIRIHLAEAGCPILGETVYIRDFPGPLLPAPRLMLHAWRLGIRHPVSGKLLRLEDPMPADMARCWEGLGKGAVG